MAKGYFLEPDKLILNFPWKNKHAIARKILKKRKGGGNKAYQILKHCISYNNNKSLAMAQD